MKLIRCHIENFGKLSDVSVDFRQNCHIICEENGWGKSTLTAFIRVMFFGFAEEKARDELKNERKRYRPWQGGVYGGQLEFETGGERYVITRAFGAREREDSFSLREKATNLESGRFSDRVGEELFKLDSSSFCRTVFVSQNDCETFTTDGINAKIGNLAEATDDINNYERVNERLGSLLNRMSPARSTGALYKTRNEIARLEENVRAGGSVNQTLEETYVRMHQKYVEQGELKEKQAELMRKQQEISAYKDIQARQEKYTSLCQEYESRKQKEEEARRYFPGSLPNPGELDIYIAESTKIPALEENVNFYRLSPEERQKRQALAQRFGEACPAEEDLKAQGDSVRHLHDLKLAIASEELSGEERETLQAYDRQFREGIPEQQKLDDVISNWKSSMDKRNVLNQRRAALETLRNLSRINLPKTPQTKKSGMTAVGIAGLLLGFVAAVAGILCIAFTEWMLAGIALLLIGIVMGILSLAFGRRRQAEAILDEEAVDTSGMDELQREIEREEQFIVKVEQDTAAFLAMYDIPFEDGRVLDRLYDLKSNVREYMSLARRRQEFQEKDLEGQRQATAEKIRAFLHPYFPEKALNEADFSDAIDELRAQTSEFARLRVKRDNYERAGAAYQELLTKLQGYIGALCFQPKENLQSQLTDIQRHLQSYHTCLAEYENARRQKEDFEKAEDVEQILRQRPVEDVEALETINQRLTELAEMLERNYEHIADYSRRLDELRDEADRVSEDEQNLSGLREEYDRGLRKYELMKKTKEYLEQAKSSLTARYTGPIRASFGKYYGILSRESDKRYHMDANTHVTVDELGMQREPKFLSAGYRDLIGICMRMALVDAMYQEEKPFLVFDDPFANLDANKAEGAMQLLREISGEYQVLYFTCHESRAPEIVSG